MKDISMHIYSPEPISAYKDRLGSLSQMLCEVEVGWNLIWLSIPGADRLLEPDINVRDFVASFNTTAAGSLMAVSSFHTEDGELSVAELMVQSPVQFVQTRCDLQRYKSWAELGGQEWIEIMTERAYQSEGRSNEFQAAQAAAIRCINDVRMKRSV